MLEQHVVGRSEISYLLFDVIFPAWTGVRNGTDGTSNRREFVLVVTANLSVVGVTCSTEIS